MIENIEGSPRNKSIIAIFYGRKRGIVLRDMGGHMSLVTHQFNVEEGLSSTYWGHYFQPTELKFAFDDFSNRVRNLLETREERGDEDEDQNPVRAANT